MTNVYEPEDIQPGPAPKVERVMKASPNNTLWSVEPALSRPDNEKYVGRVFMEVWDQVVQTANSGKGDALVLEALAILEDQKVQIKDNKARWTNEPAMGPQEGQTFLGRVVVEVWSKRGVVHITGSQHDIVLQRAIQELRTFLPPPE